MVATAALAACGSGAKDPVGMTQVPRSDKVVVAALGDSITAGTPFYTPSLRMGDSSAAYTATAQKRFPQTAFRNCGVNGERTDEIAQRFAACTKGAGIVIIQGGINDIAQNVPLSLAAENIEAMVREAKKRGLRVGVCEVLPWNNGYPVAASAIKSLNASINRIAKREGATVEHWYSVLEDPAAPGRMRENLTVDGDHPTQGGYALLGKALRLPR